MENRKKYNISTKAAVITGAMVGLASALSVNALPYVMEPNCDVIVINNGEITTSYDAESRERYTSDSYEVIKNADGSTYIYVYGTGVKPTNYTSNDSFGIYEIDKDARREYTDFIASNIYVKDDNSVFIDKDSINEVNYQDFKDNLNENRSRN